jgi:hypothetical protein
MGWVVGVEPLTSLSFQQFTKRSATIRSRQKPFLVA